MNVLQHSPKGDSYKPSTFDASQYDRDKERTQFPEYKSKDDARMVHTVYEPQPASTFAIRSESYLTELKM